MISRYRSAITMLICVWLMVSDAHAQRHFLFSQPISKADSSGFYKIALSPELLAKSNTSLADLRILADNDKETAYVVETARIGHVAQTEPLEIVSKSIAADKNMHVVLRNGGGIVSDFLLQVQNTDAFRTVNISGSSDQKQWFIIKENITLEKSNENAVSGSYTVTFHVEPVNYTYFDISFKEKEMLPVNIITVSSIQIQRATNAAALFDTLTTSIVTQKDSLKRSYVSINWRETYPLTRLQLLTSGAKYFRREGFVRSSSGDFPFVIDSENDGWIDIDSKSRLVEIVIVNADNQPLKISGVKGLVRKHYLYAWLEKDKTYALYFGDSSLSTPDYDLAYFKDRIKENTPMLSLGAISSIDTKTSMATNETSKAKKWMWWALGLVLAIMLVFTYKLINDMNNRQKS